MASRLEEIELAIARLPQNELKAFRSWYERFDADAWDRQIEKDAGLGKLDALANEAIAEYEEGRIKKL